MSRRSMDKFKNLVVKINTNPFFVFGVSICSIIGFISSWFYDNLIIQIINTFFFFAFIVVIIIRSTTYVALKKKAYREISEVYEIIKGYNIQYKKSYDDIANEEVGTYRHLDNILKPISEHLSHLSQKVIEDKSSICIKMIDVNSLMNDDFINWKVKTIARSSSTKPKRLKADDKLVPISKNSDFKIILEGKDPFYSSQFAVPSLPILIEQWKKVGREYENSTDNYLDKYKSTIVIPIKTQTGLVSDLIKKEISTFNQSHYHIIGFLCWDSNNVYISDYDKEKFEELTDLLDSYACILYPLLESYLTLLIKKEKGKITSGS